MFACKADAQRFLTSAEVATLADAIHGRYRALVLVGAYGGLRIGELAGLRRNRVDLLRGTVQVAEKVVEELAVHLVEAGDPEGFVFTAPQGGPLRVTGFRARVW